MSLDHSGADVSLQKVSKRFGGFVALTEIDIDVPAGSFCSFLGPSGSGKTTTLNIVGGLLAPSSGRVFINGRDATDLAPDKRGLGVVFQSYALFPHMTVRKNIAYPLKLRGASRDEQRRCVGEALELVRLADLAERYPSQLSGGQQQRIALARAFVFRPPVLLMDEPMGALDAGLRQHLQREIVRITRELGCTVLYVTHDQEEALSMSDQVVLFDRGAVVQSGSPTDIYRKPRTEFAATFVGAGRLLKGVVERRDGAHAIRTPYGPVPVDERSIADNGLAVGQPAAAVFRPETASFGKHLETSAGALPLFEGRVRETVFAGGQIRFMVALGDAEIECRLPVGKGNGAPGEQVRLYIDAEQLPVAVAVAAP